MHTMVSSDIPDAEKEHAYIWIQSFKRFLVLAVNTCIGLSQSTDVLKKVNIKDALMLKF